METRIFLLIPKRNSFILLTPSCAEKKSVTDDKSKIKSPIPTPIRF